MRRHQSASVLVPALRTVGNIVTGDDLQVCQYVERHGSGLGHEAAFHEGCLLVSSAKGMTVLFKSLILVFPCGSAYVLPVP